MRHTIIYTALVGLLAILPLTGCSKPAAPPVANQESTLPAVGVSLCSTDGPWREQMKTDIKAAAAGHSDFRLIVKDAHNDAAEQRAQLGEFLTSRVSVVIVSPKDAQAITEPVAKLVEAGIPVIVLDRAVIGDKYTCFIAADPEQIGTAAGKWLAGRLQGKGKLVALKGPVDSLWHQRLQAALRAALRDPGYHVVYDNRVDPPKIDAGQLMKDALDSVEEIDAVLAYDDAAAYAAYQTTKAQQRGKGTLFVGIGGLPSEGAAYVSQGILDATFLYPTGGAEAVDAAVKLLGGGKVPKKIVPPTRTIAKGT